MIFQYDDYKAWLNFELKQKIKENPLYSGNSFAKRLGVSQSYLSMILNGRRKLSIDKANDIAEKLKLSDSEKDFLIHLVKKDSTKFDDAKEFFDGKLNHIRSLNNFSQLDIDLFNTISDWKSNAVYTLLGSDSGKFTIEDVSHKLGLNISEVDEAIKKLISVELLVLEDGKYKRTNKNIIFCDSAIKSSALRKFHKEILKKANTAIENQSIDQRVINGATLPIDKEKYPIFKEKMQKFLEEIMSLCSDSSPDREVYQMSMQFFKLEKDENDGE